MMDESRNGTSIGPFRRKTPNPPLENDDFGWRGKGTEGRKRRGEGYFQPAL